MPQDRLVQLQNHAFNEGRNDGDHGSLDWALEHESKEWTNDNVPDDIEGEDRSDIRTSYEDGVLLAYRLPWLLHLLNAASTPVGITVEKTRDGYTYKAGEHFSKMIDLVNAAHARSPDLQQSLAKDTAFSMLQRMARHIDSYVETEPDED